MARQNKVKNDKGETLKAGCVVVNEKGEVLLVSDRAMKIWQFPKGHAEEGETLEQVALREVAEETGYEVEISRKLPDITYTHGQTEEPVRVAMYLAKPISTIGKGERKTVSKWVSVEGARAKLYPNLIFLLGEITK